MANHDPTNGTGRGDGPGRTGPLRCYPSTPTSHAMFPAFLCGLMMSRQVDETQNRIKAVLRQVEVRTSHVGMALDPVVFDHVLDALRDQQVRRASLQAVPTAAAGWRLAAER